MPLSANCLRVLHFACIRRAGQHTTSTRSLALRRCRPLDVFELGLLNQLLFVFVLVVNLRHFASGGNSGLVLEAIEDTKGERGVAEDLV